MKKSKTREELLASTVEYYKTHNRSEDGCTCRYINENGYRCAIGKELSESKCLEIEKDGGGTVKWVFDKLPEHLRDMGVGFLTDLQLLHDRAGYWIPSDKSGYCNLLSGTGKTHYNRIISKFNLKLEKMT